MPYVFPVTYRSLDSIYSVLTQLYPDIRFAMAVQTRSISFVSSQSDFRAIKAVIEKLDTVPQQLEIEVKVLELTSADFLSYDQVFSRLGDSFYYSYDSTKGSVKPVNDVVLQLAGQVQDGSATLLAQPRLTSINQYQSSIKVGDRIPYVTKRNSAVDSFTEIHYLDSGIDLQVTPTLRDDKTIACDISLTVSSIKYWKDFGSFEYPVLSTREAKTTVSLAHGQTLVLAGLYDKVSKTTESKVPILGYIPFLGHFFTSKVSEELDSDIVFMITPKIVGEQEVAYENKKALE